MEETQNEGLFSKQLLRYIKQLGLIFEALTAFQNRATWQSIYI